MKYKTKIRQAMCCIAGIMFLASGPQLQAQTTTDDEVFLNNLIVSNGISIDKVLFLGDYSFDEISTKKIDVEETEYVYEQRFGKRVFMYSSSSNKTIIDYNPRTDQLSYYSSPYWRDYNNNFIHDIWSFQRGKRDSLFISGKQDPTTTRMILLLPTKSGSTHFYLPNGRESLLSELKITTDAKGRIIWIEYPYDNNNNVSSAYIRYNNDNRIEHIKFESPNDSFSKLFGTFGEIFFTSDSEVHISWKDRNTIERIGNTYYEITERGSDGHWTSMTEYYFDEDGNRVDSRLLKRIVSDPVERVRIADAKRREALRQALRQKKIAEARRQAQLDSLISVRNTTQFSIEDLNCSRYSRIKSNIDSKIRSVIEKNFASNEQYSIEDKVSISYNGQTEHDINITGSSESLIRSIKESVEDMEFNPETIGAPGLDTTVTVSTCDTYEFDYTTSVETENLVLVKNANDVKMRKGNAGFYNSNKHWIDSPLSANGVYNLDATKKEINKITIDRDVSINSIRLRTPNLMIGISYSPIAPIWLIAGYNNIGASPFGIYGKFGSTSGSGSYAVGATCSITNFAYLACGAGVHKSVTLPPEFVAEANIIIRPVPRFGISVGYSYMPGTQSGSFDIGLIMSFYLKKK